MSGRNSSTRLARISIPAFSQNAIKLAGHALTPTISELRESAIKLGNVALVQDVVVGVAEEVADRTPVTS